MNKYEKSIRAMPQILKVLFAIFCMLNLAIPLSNDGIWKFSVFQILICIIYFVGLLAGLGILITDTQVRKGDVEIYEQNTSPVIIGLGILRIIEGLFNFIFRRHSFNWKYFSFLIVIDLIYIMFLLIDKARYGYAKEINHDDTL